MGSHHQIFVILNWMFLLSKDSLCLIKVIVFEFAAECYLKREIHKPKLQASVYVGRSFQLLWLT